jgi:hypothetical protein
LDAKKHQANIQKECHAVTAKEVKALLANPTISPDELYRARILPISRNGIYQAIKNGEIEAVGYGRKKAIVTASLRKKLGMEPA